MPDKLLRIMGTRGVPAAHGGFETFAECLALYLVEQGWKVVIYCQEEGAGSISQDVWHGVQRIRIPVDAKGTLGTIVFDWKATVHASKSSQLVLTLGYNTAIFCLLLRIKGVKNVINMDGIEWKRKKWGKVAKAWFWLNDWAGCWLGNHLVADHPEIAKHLQTRVAAKKITTIAYGGCEITSSSTEPVLSLGLVPGRFLTVIARAEPENSILEIVKGFSAKPRGYNLVILGDYKDGNLYHEAVKSAASNEVRFIGAIYDRTVVQALRFHSIAYIHGHQVGGTNPSLVEALGAGNAIIAHNNRFNRWVAGDGAVYFDGAESFADHIEELAVNPIKLQQLRTQSLDRFHQEFKWLKILKQYEELLYLHIPTEIK